MRLCNFHLENGGWTKWGAYTACTKTCGGGTKSRSRSCTNPRPFGGGRECSGTNKQTVSCNSYACTSDCKDWKDLHSGERAFTTTNSSNHYISFLFSDTLKHFHIRNNIKCFDFFQKGCQKFEDCAPFACDQDGRCSEYIIYYSDFRCKRNLIIFYILFYCIIEPI